MKLLIDSNVVLDVLLNRTQFYGDSSMIMKMCETNLVEGVVSSLTIANLVYVMRRELNAEKTAEVLNTLSLIFHIADLTAEDVKKAAELKWDDYEDALQAITAKRICADYIATRNIKDFKNSETPALPPSKLLDIVTTGLIKAENGDSQPFEDAIKDIKSDIKKWTNHK